MKGVWIFSYRPPYDLKWLIFISAKEKKSTAYETEIFESWRNK